MKILLTGSTGFMGKALIPFFQKAGHEVVRLRRAWAAPGEPTWDPERETIDAGALEGFDGIIHLAGENIAALRWTAAKKERLWNSRVKSTDLLCRTVAGVARPPRWILCASAVGYYGNRGEEILREDTTPGADFLANLCRAWEAAAEPAVRKGIPVTHLRLGVILGPSGGVLGRMLIPFRLGLGGKIGTGRQYMPWMSLDDALGAVGHVIEKGITGPVNFVAPEAVSNGTFSAELGRALHRPAFLPLPAFVARLALGEMAEALFLASQRVEPTVLVKSGYRFKHPQLRAALNDILRGAHP